MERLLAYIAVFLLGCSDVLGGCGKYDVDQCMEPITDYRHKLDISDDLKYFPIETLTTNELDKYCSYGKQSVACLNNLNDCSAAEEYLFRGFRAATVYLCDESLEEYKAHQQCFLKVRGGLQQCDEKGARELRNIDPSHDFDARHEFCSAIDDALRCIEDAVKPTCGEEAAMWQTTYEKKLLDPIVSRVHCGMLPRWAIYAIIVVACLIFGVAIRCCVYYIRQKRKNSADTQFNNVLAPPPYGKVI